MGKRTTRITIETERVLIVRGANSSRAWCTRCGAEVDTVEMSAAGVLAQTDHDTLQRWLDSEQIHLSRAPDQSARICLKSLLKSVRDCFPQRRGLDAPPPRFTKPEK